MTSLLFPPTKGSLPFNPPNPPFNSSSPLEMANGTTTIFIQNAESTDSNDETTKSMRENTPMETGGNKQQKFAANSLENGFKNVTEGNETGERQSCSSKSSNSPPSSSSNSTTIRPEKRRWEKPELCLICGQPAQCLNFGAHCCHACRMFFRRSVLNFKKLTCKYKGNCDITKGKNCRSCRFDACVISQLDISLIQFPPEFNVAALEQSLAARREELLMKRNNNNQKIVETIDGNAIAKSFSSIITLMEFHKSLNILMMAEKHAKTIRNSPNNLLLEYFSGKSLAELLTSQINILNFVELFTENGYPLKNDEIRMMEPNGVPFIGNYLNLDILLNIELMRNLPIFDGMLVPLEDKLLIFQQNVHRATTMSTAFYSTEFNSDTLIYPNGVRPFNLCRITLENGLTDEKLKRYLNLRRRAFFSVIEEFKTANLSSEEFVLLRAIIFCNNVPSKCFANTKMLLKIEAERYGQILLRNLQTKLGEFVGARKFAECLCFATKIFDYNRGQAKFYQLIDQIAFGIQNGPNPLHPPFVFECLKENENKEIFFEIAKKI